MGSDECLDSSAGETLFACTLCGVCCKGYGGTYLAPADIDAIASHLGVPRQVFIHRYTCLSGGRRLIAQGENGYCIFWDHVCTIHPVKPRMCRDWPFIRSVLVDPANWRIMAASCPGIQKDISIRRVQDHIRRLNSAV